MSNEVPALQNFINFLNHNNFIDKSLLPDESEDGFRNRLKLQKFVYLAQERFGWDLGYSFTMYKHGPYSPDLANDYYDETNFLENDGYFEVPDEFEEQNFVQKIKVDSKWLETAATLLSLSHHFPQQDKLIEKTANMKSHIEKKYIANTYEEMLHYNLIQCK